MKIWLQHDIILTNFGRCKLLRQYCAHSFCEVCELVSDFDVHYVCNDNNCRDQLQGQLSCRDTVEVRKKYQNFIQAKYNDSNVVPSQNLTLNEKFNSQSKILKIDTCPGTFGQGCGAPLRWVEPIKAWGCSLYPQCKYVLNARTSHQFPFLSLQVYDDSYFKIIAGPGAEEAVSQRGGVASIIKSILSFNAPSKKGALIDFYEQSCEQVLIPLDKYKQVQIALYKKGYLSQGGSIPPKVLQSMAGIIPKAGQCEVEMRVKQMPVYFHNLLQKFQLEGVQFVLQRFGRGLIADEMGVGKTLQAIALAMCYQEDWPLLIIVPASMRLVWASQLEWWLPNTILDPYQIHVIQSSQDRIDFKQIPKKIVITSYQMLTRLSCENCCDGKYNNCQHKYNSKHQCMSGAGWGMVIADESHTLRTTKMPKDAICTEIAYAAVRRAKRAVMLTGTPSLSRPFDLFRQIDSLQPGLLGDSKYQFAHRYCDKKFKMVRGRYLADYSGGSRLDELHQVLKKEVMIRRLKSDIAQHLPRKTRNLVMLPPPTNFLSYNHTISIQHATGMAKVQMIIPWLLARLGFNSIGEQQDASNTSKILLFCHHKDVMESYARVLEGFMEGRQWQGVKFVFIDGSIDSKGRLEAVQRFHDEEEVRVALVSITAGGVGLDFSTASEVIFGELPSEVSWLVQAESRAHRRNALKPVSVYFMCAKGTSDEQTWLHINRSLKNLHHVHDGVEEQGMTIDNTIELSGENCGISKPSNKHFQSHCTIASKLHQINNTQETSSNLKSESSSQNLRFLISKNTERVHLYWNLVQSFSLNQSQLKISLSSEEFESQNWQYVQDVDWQNTMHKLEHHFNENNTINNQLSNQNLNNKNLDKKCLETQGTSTVVPIGISFPIKCLQVSNSKDVLIELTQFCNSSNGKANFHLGKWGIFVQNQQFSLNPDNIFGQLVNFVSKWDQLRSIHKKKLYGKILPLDFEDLIVSNGNNLKNQLSSNIRKFTLKQLESQVLQGTSLNLIDIVVAASRGKGRKHYYQDFKCLVDSDSNCICLNCCKQTTPIGKVQNGQQIFGYNNLYCSTDCQQEYLTKSSNKFLRQEMFRLERGVCTLCGLDCHSIAQKLKFIGSSQNFEDGIKILEKYAPKFLQDKFNGIRNHLINNPVDGNAWHVDHITPVWKGGGMCDFENLRTLCVVCHQEQTSKQAEERALRKRIS